MSPRATVSAICFEARLTWLITSAPALYSIARRRVRNELLDHRVSLIVGELFRGRFHEVGRRSFQRARNTAVETDLRAPDGVDDDARGVGRIPNFELDLQIERNVAESRAFHADVAPFSVFEPGRVITGSDVDVRCSEVVINL